MNISRNVALAGLVGLCGALPAAAQSLEELRNDGKNPDNVLTYGMGYSQQRFSPLAKIDKNNVKRLVPVWSVGLENEFGEQAQPLIYNGVMYVSNAKWTVAIDALTGRQLWRTAVEFVPETPRVVCCGVSNKGVALFNGKVFRTTLDAYVVALDQKTGKELWKSKVMDWKDGYSMTAAPVVANGVLITGISGAEFGIRGFIDGWDPETGKQLWRRHTTAAPGESGGNSWPDDKAYLNGGGSTWITGSYDPDLDLLYWGVGNAGPWNANYRRGDNLYTASVIAVRPKTGEIVWHYQFTPNEAYDYDAVSELILGELKVAGQPRKVVMQLNRNGFVYVLDRANGKLLAANPYGKVNWATHVDMATGRPVESDVAKRIRAGEEVELWPSIVGVKNWQHAAFNPNTGLMYTNTLHMFSKFKLTPIDPPKPGARYIGAQFTVVAATNEPKGFIEAIDPMTGKAKWKLPLNDHANWSAMLATGSGLLFTGRHSGEFQALDADTGKTLWEFQTSSGVTSMPVTWTHQGKQYVTVLSGLGGLGVRFARDALKNVPLGGSVWTFALPQ